MKFEFNVYKKLYILIASVILLAVAIVGLISFINYRKTHFYPSSDTIYSNLNQAMAVFNVNVDKTRPHNDLLNTRESLTISSRSVSNIFFNSIYSKKYNRRLLKRYIYLNKLGFAYVSDSKNPFSKSSKMLNGRRYHIDNKKAYYVKIYNGPSYAFNLTYPACNGIANGYNNICGSVTVDVNSNKKPNLLNVDIFELLLVQEGKKFKLVPNQKTMTDSVKEICYRYDTDCSIFVLDKDTSYLNKHIAKRCGKNAWLSKNMTCCYSDNTESCCSGKFLKKGDYHSKQNICCNNQNQSEICCKALTNTIDAKLENGVCKMGIRKGSISKGQTSIQITAYSRDLIANILDYKTKNSILVMNGFSKSKFGVNTPVYYLPNVNIKDTYLLKSNHKDIGVVVNVIDDSCKIKHINGDYYLISNLKEEKPCQLIFSAGLNLPPKKKLFFK